MKRLGYYSKLNKINETSRIAKSNFVITEWIVRGKLWEKRFKKHKKSKKQRLKLKSYYKKKHEAILEMVKTGMLSVKIYRPDERDFVWLYVFEQEMEGIKISVVLPYTEFKDIIGIDEKDLEQTDIHVDSISVENKNLHFVKQNASKFNFNFIMENLEKSRKKLITKMEESK